MVIPPKWVMVNMTTFRPNVDTTVILYIGDHPFVRHKTVINYGDAHFCEIMKINEALKKELVSIKDPVSDNLLQKIQNGLLESMETPKISRNTAEKVGADTDLPPLSHHMKILNFTFLLTNPFGAPIYIVRRLPNERLHEHPGIQQAFPHRRIMR